MTQYVSFESTVLATLLFLLLVIGFYAVRPLEERRALMVIAVASYLLKAALVPVYFWALISVGLQGTAHIDPIKYHGWSREMAIEIELGLPHLHRGWTSFSSGYLALCAYLYSWFGPNTLVPRMLNAAVSSLSLLYLYRLGKLYFDQRVARLAVLLTAFLPFTMLIVLEHRKDPIVQLLAMFVVYHAALLLKFDRRWPRSVAFIVLALVPMYFMRGAFVVPFLGLIAISFILARRNVLVAAVATVPVLLLVAATQFYAPEGSQLSVQTNIERLQGKIEDYEARKRTGQLIERGGLTRLVHIQSPTEIWKAPISAAVTLISPFPPTFPPRFPDILYTGTNLICLLLYPWLIIGVLSVLREEGLRERLFLLLFPTVFLVIIGAVLPGTARYRETVFPIILLLIAVGLHQRSNMLISALTYAGLAGLAAIVYAVRLT